VKIDTAALLILELWCNTANANIMETSNTLNVSCHW